MTRCPAQYPNRERGDRIVECHLVDTHDGPHEEADTGFTWEDPMPTEAPTISIDRVSAKDLIHPVLHRLDVRIPALRKSDCQCNLVAEVVLDALFGTENRE